MSQPNFKDSLTHEFLRGFLAESNMIEGIRPCEPSYEAYLAALQFLMSNEVYMIDLRQYQQIIAPNQPLRNMVGMDVTVGGRPCPRGGPHISELLSQVIARANEGAHPWTVHVIFQELHPFMDGNGRTGRLLWLWQMLWQHVNQIAHNERGWSFLRTFYYQTLQEHTDQTGRSRLQKPKRPPIHEEWAGGLW